MARNSAELRERLFRSMTDKLWRLKNLYCIKDAETGRIIPFRPRSEQLAIYEALLCGARRIIILKARRLGMSTAIDVFAADEAAFNAGVQISIVDQNQADAARKLSGIVKVALDGLPKALRESIRILRDNDGSLELSSQTGDTPSVIFAGRNARGGTNQLLHISEWGVIQADDPARSEEILTGALPSAEHGVTIVETTWKGGRGGHLWNLVCEAQQIPEAERTPRDWRLFFFPWWIDPSYSESGGEIDAETARYLSEKEAELGRAFTEGQKRWYARRRRTLGAFMCREFPTTIDECFRAPIEGAIYASLLDKLRSAGGICQCAVDGASLVHTFWDLGSPGNTVTWYAQVRRGEIHLVDCDMTLDLTPVQRVAHILAKGYNLGTHFLPHDAAATERSGRTFLNELSSAGLPNLRVLPRTHDVWIGINRLRQLMPRMTFRLPACERGIEALQNYRTQSPGPAGVSRDEPLHDWSSHTADALRSLAEAEMAGLIPGDGGSHSSARKRPTIMDVGRTRRGTSKFTNNPFQ
jgi:hypothetical protein